MKRCYITLRYLLLLVIFSVNNAFAITSATKKLYKAVMRDDIKKVRRLLYPSRFNFLSCSVLYKTPDINNNSGSLLQDTPLHDALRFDYCRIATLLLEQDSIDATIKNRAGETPLHLAAHRGYTDIVGRILQLPAHRPNINAETNSGLTALHLSLINEKRETALFLLQQPDISAHATRSTGSSVLHLAAKNGYLDVVQAILRLPIEQQPDINTELDLALVREDFQAARLINEHTIYRKVQQLLTERNCSIPQKILQRMLIIHPYCLPLTTEFEQITNVLSTQQDPALSESMTNIVYLCTNQWKSIESISDNVFGVRVHSVDAILRLRNPNYTLNDLPLTDPNTEQLFTVSKDEILRLANHLIIDTPPCLNEIEIESLKMAPNSYRLEDLVALVKRRNLLHKLKYVMQNQKIPADQLDEYYKIFDVASSDDFSLETIREGVTVYHSQQDPALSQSESNIVYCDNFRFACAEQNTDTLLRIPICSVDAILRLTDPDYTVEVLRYYLKRSNDLTTNRFTVSKDEILRLANHLITDKTPSFNEAEIRFLEIAPNAYSLTRLVTLSLMHKLRDEMQRQDVPIDQLEEYSKIFDLSSSDDFSLETIREGVTIYRSQQDPALNQSESNIVYCGNNIFACAIESTYTLLRIPIRSVDAILRLRNPNYTLDDLPSSGYYLDVSKDEILRLVGHLMQGLPRLTESEIETLKIGSNRYSLTRLTALTRNTKAIMNELQKYDIPQNQIPLLIGTTQKYCNHSDIQAVVTRAVERYYNIEDIVKEEITKRSMSYSREFFFQILKALTDILTEHIEETIQQMVLLYCIQIDPELSLSQTNAVYCGKKNWLTQNGYNLLTAFAQRNNTLACNPATQQPVLFKLPVKSIDALLRLENPTYDVDAVPLRDPSLHHEEFVVSKDELIRIAHHLCTHHNLAALTDEEIGRLRDETDPQMHTVRALVELLQQKIKEQQPQAQQDSSADILSAEEAILMLQQDALLTMEQAARVLPLFSDQQRISLQKVKRFIAKRLEIIQPKNLEETNDNE